jgi:hypothetical protein
MPASTLGFHAVSGALAMELLREFARRLSMLIHRRRFDADLEDEMRLHLELRRQEQLQSGTHPRDAHAAARRRFGNVTI